MKQRLYGHPVTMANHRLSWIPQLATHSYHSSPKLPIATLACTGIHLSWQTPACHGYFSYPQLLTGAHSDPQLPIATHACYPPVMANHHERLLPPLQVLFQPQHRTQIQMVCGLIQQQKRGLDIQRASEGDAHAPATTASWKHALNIHNVMDGLYDMDCTSMCQPPLQGAKQDTCMHQSDALSCANIHGSAKHRVHRTVLGMPWLGPLLLPASALYSKPETRL
eukprot:1146717-Pelagomonas_calceolata.AAC.10